jgi:hypothetical protein
VCAMGRALAVEARVVMSCVVRADVMILCTRYSTRTKNVVLAVQVHCTA